MYVHYKLLFKRNNFTSVYNAQNDVLLEQQRCTLLTICAVAVTYHSVMHASRRTNTCEYRWHCVLSKVINRDCSLPCSCNHTEYATQSYAMYWNSIGRATWHAGAYQHSLLLSKCTAFRLPANHNHVYRQILRYKA